MEEEIELAQIDSKSTTVNTTTFIVQSMRTTQE
jgi:hypothetical protein